MDNNTLYDKIKNFIKKEWKSILIIVIIFLIFNIRVPYEVEMPGGTINLNDRVTVNGESINPSGSYNMAYVSTINGSLPYVLIGLINPNWEVVKTSDYVAENESIEDYYERNRVYLEQSISNAKLVALKTAGKDYTITKEYRTVVYIDEKAQTNLELKDEVISIDDLTDLDASKIKEYLNTKNEGDEVTIKAMRDNEEVTCYAKLFQTEDDDQKYIGISIATYNDVESDYDIEMKNKGSESGPSGGLMMTLMMYEGITGKDLTKGKTIVGTGTIESDGTVGEIGGVKYKIMGAEKNNADIFLVPEGNYEEAKDFVNEKKYDIMVVSVSNIEDAINYLEEQDE